MNSEVTQGLSMEGIIIANTRGVLDESQPNGISETEDIYLQDSAGALFEIQHTAAAFEAAKPLVGQKVEMMISLEAGHTILNIKDATGALIYNDESNIVQLETKNTGPDHADRPVKFATA